MKKQFMFVFAGMLVCCLLMSCKTISGVMGKPSYDPSTYGTEALIETIRSTKSTGGDSEGAAKELANRKLSRTDGQTLLGLLQDQKNRKTRLALLKTMVAQNMTYLRDDLAAYISKAPDAATATEAAMTVVAFTEDAGAALAFTKTTLLEGAFPELRARSAKLLAGSFPAEAESLFIQALEKETSASSATFMCEFLAQKGGSGSFEILKKIANDVTRPYQTDNYLGVKTTTETVRAAAVRGAERLRVD
jgi:hypothetical protein